jgi:hypothetical protein
MSSYNAHNPFSIKRSFLLIVVTLAFIAAAFGAAILAEFLGCEWRMQHRETAHQPVASFKVALSVLGKVLTK